MLSDQQSNLKLNNEVEQLRLELAASRRQIDNILEQAPICYLQLDDRGVILTANREARDLFGKSQLNGRSLSDFIDPKHQQIFFAALERVNTEFTPNTFEIETHANDDQVRILRCHLQRNPISANSENASILLTATDATERFLAANRVRVIIDCSPDAMIIFNEHGQILDSNQQAELLFSSTRTDLRELQASELLAPHFHRKYGPKLIDLLKRRTLNGRIALFKLKLRDSFFGEFSAVTKVSSIKPSLEQLYVASIRDITNERSAIKSAMKSRSAALRASRTKSQFLANMSHELRTPITAIMGFAELLEDESLTSDALRYLDSIKKNSEHLRQVINDILDISSIESGKLKINKKSCNIREVITEAFETMRVYADDKKLNYQLFIADNVPTMGTVDALRVKQVLLNLVGNALKFTDNGFVHVDAHLTKGKNGNELLEVVISDSGCGITEQNASSLFTLFYQADSGTNRRFGGTGLGLAVSKNLSALMDGDVRLLHSKPGEGSAFVFSLQISGQDAETSNSHESSNSAPPREIDQPLSKMKVLVVEDGEDIQLLLKSFLRKAGAVVDQAINGLEGYEKALAGNYDAVLMDIQMPIVDGLEATAMLRRRNYSQPIIAVSANAFPRDVSLSLKAGCNDHISKPIQYEMLINKLKYWTTNAGNLHA